MIVVAFVMMFVVCVAMLVLVASFVVLVVTVVAARKSHVMPVHLKIIIKNIINQQYFNNYDKSQ